ncbi:MAG: hypothetical protein NTY30_03510 [Candidatus Berkelbacteria bacterium]|nr:hypothetical protein [Candidatus Berkelbacteria bacterium]
MPVIVTILSYINWVKSATDFTRSVRIGCNVGRLILIMVSGRKKLMKIIDDN